MTSPSGDERLIVVRSRRGIWVLVDGRRLPRPFLDLSKRVALTGTEEGLLSLVLESVKGLT